MRADPLDAEQRRAALDPERSFIVQAPAGSGKTGLLIQRFLVLLSRAARPEEVVAITFTRKAAAEMRGRILEALDAAGAPEPPGPAHARLTWALASAARRRDQQAGWSLLRQPARLKILTIDGLCRGIVSRAPVTSGLGGAPDNAEEPVALYRQAASRTLRQVEESSRWTEPVAQLLNHLDNDLGRAEGFLTELLGRRDQWLRHLAGGRVNREALEGALRRLVQTRLGAFAATLPVELAARVPELAAFAGANLAGLKPDAPLVAWEGRDRLPPAEAEALDLWRGLADLLLTDAGAWRRQVTIKQGFPPASQGRSREEKQRFTQYKQTMQALLCAVAGEEELRIGLQGVRELPPIAYGEEQWALMEALAVLLPLAAAQLRVVFAETAQVDYVEVGMGAQSALGDSEAPTDLALKLDSRINHLLVDEFQDTSRGQFQLLERLTAGWDGRDGRTLFLVGDPMQSIYRFREAEVGLFFQARRRGLGELPLEYLRLGVNFRSEAALVDWCNDLFGALLPESEDPLTGAAPFEPSEPFERKDDSGGEASIYGFGPGEEEAEAAQVAALAREALERDGEESVAILARARTHLGRIIPALRREGIAYQAVEIAALAGRPAVRDLLALTRALLHPGDRLSWFALLRGPLCGLTLDDLLILGERSSARTPWERINDPEALGRLSEAGAARLVRPRLALERALAAARRSGFFQGPGTLRRWVAGCWRELGGDVLLASADQQADAALFLDLLESLERGGTLVDFAELERRLADLRASAAAPARLQVMTIHKAKGLEFDTVILPGLGRRQPPSPSRLLQWLEGIEGEGSDSLILAPVRRADESDADPMQKFLRGVEKEKERLESARLLYVAATRARSRLRLLGAVGRGGRPEASSLLSLIWERFAEHFPEPDPEAETDEAPEAGPPVQILQRLPSDWRPMPPPPGLARAGADFEIAGDPPIPFEWAGETVRITGVVAHRWLRVMARDGVDRWPEARIQGRRGLFAVQLARQGMAEAAIDGAVDHVVRTLIRATQDPRGQWILDPGHAESASELALSGLRRGRVVRMVLDRTFVDAEGRRWIIDFKTGQHSGGDLDGFLDNEQERYRAQLESYAALMARRESRPIFLGLYFPLFSGWRAWSWGASAAERAGD